MTKSKKLLIVGKRRPAVPHKKKSTLRKVDIVTTMPMGRHRPHGRSGLSAGAARYAQALVDPFHPDAMGARITDEYFYPSVPQFNRLALTLTSSSAGAVQGLFTPSPIMLYADTTLTTGALTGANLYPHAPGCYYSISNANLTNKFASYRVVAFGVKIRTLMSPFTVTGRLVLAPVPLQNTLVDEALFAATGTPTPAQVIDNLTNIAGTGAPVPVGILDLPGSIEVDAAELLDRQILFSARPVGPGARMWRNMDNSPAWSSNVFAAPDLTFFLPGGPGAQITTGALPTPYCTSTQSARFMQDYVGLMIYGSGLPASTGVFDLEVVYHLETVPVPTATVSGVPDPIPSASAPTTVRDHVGDFLPAIAAAHQTPAVSFIDEIVETAKSGIREAGHSLKRAAMHGFGQLVRGVLAHGGAGGPMSGSGWSLL